MSLFNKDLPCMLLRQEVHGRPVTVLKCNGVVYCVDSMCYHQGGPLGQGDIEEICGIPTIRCPWHAHRVSFCSCHGIGADALEGPL